MSNFKKRKGLLNVVMDELKTRSGNTTSYWSQLSESTVEKLAPEIFLEAK